METASSRNLRVAVTDQILETVDPELLIAIRGERQRQREQIDKNLIPFDPAPSRVTSGIRLGTPAVTSRGFGQAEMETVADCIVRALHNPADEVMQRELRAVTRDLCARFPVPGLEP